MEFYSLIIAGSRGWVNYDLLTQKTREFAKIFIKDKGNKPIRIISGTAQGADRQGEYLAQRFNLELLRMPADWDKHGKAAGYIRNEHMAKIANGCIVFWDGQSNGSFHMMNLAKNYKLDLWIVLTNGVTLSTPQGIIR